MKYLYISLVLFSAVFAKTRAYVTLGNTNHIEVIDLQTHRVVKKIEVGGSPFAIAASFDGTRSYVSNQDPFPNSISTVYTDSLRAFESGFVGLNAVDIKVTPKGDKLYVVNNDSNSVSVFDTQTNAVIKTIPVGIEPTNLAISPDGLKVYVTNSKDHNVSVIDMRTNEVTKTIDTGLSPRGIVVHPNGKLAYVVNNQSSTISVIDLSDETLMHAIDINVGSFEIAISPDGSRLYVANQVFNGTVNVIDTLTYQVIQTIDVGNLPFGIAVSFDGLKLYVCNNFDNTLQVIDTTTYQTIDRISLVGAPVKMALVESLPVSFETVKEGSFASLEVFHRVRWTSSSQIKAVQYHIYRDPKCTKYVGSTTSLEFEDHNREQGNSCSYFIVSEDKYKNYYLTGQGSILCDEDGS